MVRIVGVAMVAVMMALAVVPAMAGPVAPAALTDDEVSALTTQDAQVMDSVGDITGGLTYDQETFLTVAGVVIVAVILIIVIF